MKADPIIAVQNVKISSKWYQIVFDCKSYHGGDKQDFSATLRNNCNGQDHHHPESNGGRLIKNLSFH